MSSDHAAVTLADKAPAQPSNGYFQTSDGRIQFELYFHAAPASCAAFVQSIAAGGWDGAAFVRAVREDNDRGRPRIDVVQGLGHTVEPLHARHESTAETGLRHTLGTLSLARREPGTATGDHVFICVRDSPSLDAGGDRQSDGLGFAAFGKVTSGLELIERIHRAPCVQGDDDYTAGQILQQPVRIIRGVLGHFDV